MTYVQQDFDAFERKDGRVICPIGDYTQIKVFPECCSFGERCSFDGHCECEDGKEFVRIVSFEGTGSEQRKTYCFLLADGTIYVRCGCFGGTEQEFLDEVAGTYGDSHHGKAYRMFFAAAKFELTEG